MARNLRTNSRRRTRHATRFVSVQSPQVVDFDSPLATRHFANVRERDALILMPRTSGARYDLLWMYDVGTSVMKHDDPKSMTCDGCRAHETLRV